MKAMFQTTNQPYIPHQFHSPMINTPLSMDDPFRVLISLQRKSHCLPRGSKPQALLRLRWCAPIIAARWSVPRTITRSVGHVVPVATGAWACGLFH